jgi:hypothetical protein
MIVFRTPCKHSTQATYISAYFWASWWVLTDIKSANLVNRSMITQIKSNFWAVIGKPTIKSMLMSSHYQSGTFMVNNGALVVSGGLLAVIKCIYLPLTYLHFIQDIEDRCLLLTSSTSFADSPFQEHWMMEKHHLDQNPCISSLCPK